VFSVNLIIAIFMSIKLKLEGKSGFEPELYN